MIVRINQIDPQQFEGDPAIAPAAARAAGAGSGSSIWPTDGPAARIHADWSPRAYEVLILDTDEENRPVDGTFRQQQIRRMIPLAAAALADRGQTVVFRLDGPVGSGELLPAFVHLTGPAAADARYACSDFQKLQSPGPATAASLRIAGSSALAGLIFGDESIGLARSVRVRALAVPPELVPPLLDVAATDDERWQEILPHSPYLLTTTPQLRSLRILSSILEPAEIKTRLTRRLMEVAGAQPVRA